MTYHNNLPSVIYSFNFFNAEGGIENHTFTIIPGNIYLSEDKMSWYIIYDESRQLWTLNDISQEYYYASNLFGAWYNSSDNSLSSGKIFSSLDSVSPTTTTTTPTPPVNFEVPV